MADDNELLFQMRMQDQISGVMQGIEGSFKDVASVVQQQMAAMQQLTAALQAQAGGAKSATSAAQAHAAGLKAVGEAANSASSAMKAQASAVSASAAAHKEHGEAVHESGEHAKEAAEAHKGLASQLGEVTSTAKEAVEALVALYASNEMAKGAVEASEELEHTIRDIGAASGLARGEVVELQEALVKMASQKGFASLGQLEGLAKIGSTLSGSREQIEEFAAALGKISNAGNFQQIGNSIAQLLAQTNEGPEKVGALADAFGKLGMSARGGVQNLAEITNQIGRFTAGMGLSSTAIVGYAATFNKMFGPEMGRMGAANFGIMLQTISKEAREGGDGLKSLADRLGVTYEAMRKLGSEHPDEVFQKILEVTNAIKGGGGNPADFLKQFGVGDGRQLQMIEAMAEKFQDLQKNIHDAQNAGGGADAFNAKALTDYDKMVNQLGADWQELKVAFGQAFGPEVIKGLEALKTAISTVHDAFKELPDSVQTAIATIAILGPAVGGVFYAFGVGVRAIRELKEGLIGVGEAFSEMGAHSSAAATQVEASSAKMESAALKTAEGHAAVAASAREMESAVKLSWSNMALAAGTYLIAADAAHELGVGIAGLIKQQQEFGKQGVTWKDEGLGLGAMLPDALGGGYFKDKLTESFRAKREAGGEHGGGEHGEHGEHGGEHGGGHGEGHEGGEHAPAAKPNPTTPQSNLTPLEARNALADFSPAIKAAQDYQKAIEALQTALGKMDDATKAAMASEIQGAQQALELRRAELDPLNKMTDQWRQAMMSAQAYTKSQQEAAAIEKQVFDARQEAYKRGEGDAGANRAEGQVRSQQTQLNRATSDTAFSKEAEGMYRQLAASSAITQSEKDGLAVEQQIAKWQSDTSYTQAQITQLTKILALTKEWERELSQLASLNPQAASLQKYNDELAELNKLLASGSMNQAEFNREKLALDQQTKAQRDPLGNIADQNNEELKEAQVVGKYRDADVKTLQQINQLKQQGITLDAQQTAALQGSNRALADVKEAQQQLDQLSQAFGSSLQSAVTGALNGNRGALREALASLGGQLFKMGTDQIFKQLTPSVASVLPGITGAAQNANDALAKAGASQMASTMANAQQEIASAQINIANATMSAGLTNLGAQNNGVPGGLPGPAGTNLPGSTGAAGAPTQLPGAGGTPNPSSIAQVISPGTAAANAPTVPAITGTGVTNLPTAIAGGAATVAGAAGAGAVATGLPSAVAGGAFGSTGLAPTLPGNGIGSINPSQFSQAFPMPSFATSTIKGAGPAVSEADTSRWNEVFGRDPTPGEAVNIQKMGVERALDVTNNPSMKAQDSQWALGNKDWKSVDPNMTNRDYIKSLEPKDETTTTLTQPNPSFPQNGVGQIGDPSALFKLPQMAGGAAGAGGASPFGDLGSAQKAFGMGSFGDLGAAQKAFGAGATPSVFGGAATGLTGKTISLSDHDIDSIAKVANTEVDHSLAKTNPAQYDLQRQGVVDTMLNRDATGKYGTGIDDIANKKWQFTQITRNGGLDKTPAASQAFRDKIQQDIQSRADGTRQDVTGGGQSYLNPTYSNQRSLDQWGNSVVAQGRGYGAGKSTQYYGTAPGDKPVDPYGIKMPRQQGAQPSTSSLDYYKSIGEGDSYAKFKQMQAGQGGMPTPPQVDPGQMKVFGDSIGDGVKKALGADGSTLTGMNPSQVLGVLKGQGATTAQGAIAGYSGGNLNGQNVVLSSGVSNNPAQIGLVGQQLDQLKSMGAGNISLLGTGTRADLAPLNSRLAEIAKEHGAQFQGALDPNKIGPDGVHPTPGGYQSIATQLKAQQAMPRNQGIDTTPTGSINSAAKQAQDAAQQQMTQATEQFSKMQTQVQTGLKDSTQAFQQNFQGLGGSIAKTSDTALGGVGDMGSFGNSIQGMLSKLSSGGGGGGGFGGLGGLFGGGGGGGGFGDFADFSAFHSGGKVGSNTGFLTRRVSSALFLGAPKFHDGLNSDEFPAVLQRGERVLTNAQEQKTTSIVDKLADAVSNKSTPGSQRATPAAQRGAGSRVNMVVNVKDANSFRLSQSQIMAQAHSAMMRTSAKHN